MSSSGNLGSNLKTFELTTRKADIRSVACKPPSKPNGKQVGRSTRSPPPKKRKSKCAHLLAKATQLAILVRHGHALEVAQITDGLEVAADEEDVDLVRVARLQLRDVRVYRVELAVAASLDGDLRDGARWR